MQRIVKFLEVPVEVDFLQQVADKIAFNKLKDKKLDATVAVARDSKSTLFRKGNMKCHSYNCYFLHVLIHCILIIEHVYILYYN